MDFLGRIILQILVRRGGQSIFVENDRLVKLLSWVMFFIIAHIVAMVVFDSMNPFDALWLTLTTLTSTGYGDLYATSTWARIATMLLLYLPGMYLFATLISEYVMAVATKRERQRKGNWNWNMKNHIVIVNTPEAHPEQYFERLVDEFRQSDKFKDVPIQILTSLYSDGLPDTLVNMGVKHYNGRADNIDDLNAVNISDAMYVIVLSKRAEDKYTDGQTFDVVCRIRDITKEPMMIAEVVDDDNRERMLKAGVNIAVRPIRAYPSMLVSAMIAPGAEKIMEDTFSQVGSHYHRIDMLDGVSLQWKTAFTCAITSNYGQPIAYIGKDGEVYNCPNFDDVVTAYGLILMISEHNKDNQPAFLEQLYRISTAD